MAKIFRKTLYVDKSKLHSSDFVSVEKKISFGSKKTTSEWSLILLWGLIQFYMNPLPEYMQNGSSDLITCAWANQRFHSYQNILYTLISSLHIKKIKTCFHFMVFICFDLVYYLILRQWLPSWSFLPGNI